MARRASRFIDHDTSTVYYQNTPQWPTDPAVLARLEQRPDDAEDTVRASLEVFAGLAKAVQTAFPGRHIAIDGGANATPEGILGEVLRGLEGATPADKATFR